MVKEDYLAFILEKRDVGEADRYYTFLTRENGLMRVVAKGVRKPHARLASHLEDYTLSQIVIARNCGPGTLAGAYTERSHSRIRQDYRLLCALTRMRRIFLSMIQSEQRDADLFSLTDTFFIELDAPHNSCVSEDLLIEAFLHKVFAHLGYQFPLTRCGLCSESLRDQRNFFTPYEGGIICLSCIQSRRVAHSVACDANTIKMLRLMTQYKLADLKKVTYTPETMRQLQIITDVVSSWIMR